jgi:hypothetical protein
MIQFLTTAALLVFSCLNLSGCGEPLSAHCDSVCDLRDATGCSDIELSACYDLCEAYQAAPEPCGASSEVLSACLSDQVWQCTQFGAGPESPLACSEEQAYQDAACVFTQSDETENLD